MDKKEIRSVLMQARQRALSAEHIKDTNAATEHISAAFKLIIALCNALLREA